MKKRKYAFTLAEILITIGIIGVVAAMTLPTLRMNIENKILSAKTKQAYSLMSQATKMYMAQNNMFSFRSVRDCTYMTCNEKTPTLEKMVDSSLNYVRKCTDPKECFPAEYKREDGTTQDYITQNKGIAYILADGYAIYMKRTSLNNKILLFIDTNGEEEPNVYGQDAWLMHINNDGEIVSGTSSTDCAASSYACFEKFKKNGFEIKD